MGAIETLSEAPIAGKELKQMLSAMGARTEQIAKLRDYAIDSPESRKEVIEALEAYAGRHKGTKRAAKACSAISTILAVSMLEVLQGK